MNNFIFDIPTKVYFGENQLEHLGEELSKFGNKVLLTYGGGSIKRMGLYDKVINELEKAGLEVFELSGISPNPRITSVNEGAEICKKENIDVLLAVGGGSVIDCTKFIGAATYYDGDAWDIFMGKYQVKKSLPIVTILTLSATGSEMNSGGVISNEETSEKIAKGSDVLLPKVSFLDPTNTYTVSKYQTAAGSADILSHIFEVYFNNENDLFMLDTVMEGLMKTVIKYAPIAMKEPENYEARANLMWASTWAINGFVRGGKTHGWSCHAMEHQLSAYYDITHGLGLAIITPRWLDYILDNTTVNKLYQFGCNVFDIDPSLEKMVVAKLSIKMLSEFFFKELGLQSTLSEIGIDNSKFELMAKKACEGSVIRGFKTLDQNDIVNIYNMSL
jgi:hypothetical protein